MRTDRGSGHLVVGEVGLHAQTPPQADPPAPSGTHTPTSHPLYTTPPSPLLKDKHMANHYLPPYFVCGR